MHGLGGKRCAHHKHVQGNPASEEIELPWHVSCFLHLGQYLVEGSLSDAQVLARTGLEPPLPILPEANVIKVGGQSFIDRGRAAVFPLIEEIVANLGRHDR